MNEYLFSIDNFKKPKALKDNDAKFILIERIILLEPGTFPTHPNMGVGLVSRFRYSDFSELSVLQSTIKSQISTYLPQLQDVDVALSVNENKLVIAVTSEDTTYTYSYDKVNESLSSLQ